MYSHFSTKFSPLRSCVSQQPSCHILGGRVSPRAAAGEDARPPIACVATRFQYFIHRWKSGGGHEPGAQQKCT